MDCPECEATYIGETARRISIHTDEHCNNMTSHVARHSKSTGHELINLNNVHILFKSKDTANTRKRKIIEALAIKELKPSLNIQACSVPIKLF